MKTKLMPAGVLTPFLLGLLLLSASEAFAIDPNLLYQITAKHSGRCLSVQGGTLSLHNQAGIEQRNCVLNDDSQKWQLVADQNLRYRITAKHSQKSLDVRGAELGDRIRIQQYEYLGGANQQWRVIPLADGYYQIIAFHSGKSLDVDVSRGQRNGAVVQQWTYWGGDNQKWRLTEVGPANPPPVPSQGRFRVTLTGFFVNRATVDGWLIGDGQGDEVYTAIELAEISHSGLVGSIRSVVSRTYGDTSADHSLPGRIRAGDMPPNGGLQAGNSYPAAGESPPSAQDLSIPIILWEGELRSGPNANGVVILPTIWELDNNDGMLHRWQTRARDLLRTRSAALFRILEHSPLRSPFENSDQGLIEAVKDPYFDHPIGIQGDAFVPLVPGSARFIPLRILLSFNSAQAAANSTTNSFTQGRGVVDIQYEDGERYGRGNYTLFLRVDRLQ